MFLFPQGRKRYLKPLRMIERPERQNSSCVPGGTDGVTGMRNRADVAKCPSLGPCECVYVTAVPADSCFPLCFQAAAGWGVVSV